MAKSYYVVPIVKRALLPVWYEVWDNNPPFGREAEKDANLRQTRIILAYPVCCQYDGSVIICRSGLPRLSNNASRFSAGFSR